MTSALSSTAGSAAEEIVDLLLGDDQRRRQPDHIGRGGIHQEAGVACRGLDRLAAAAVSTTPRSSPRPRTWSTSG